MSVRLLVIGTRNRPDAVIDEVAGKVCCSATTLVRRCARPADVVDVVREVYQLCGEIAVLDFFDHGRPGCQRIGDDVLFQSDADPRTDIVGLEIIDELAPMLSDTAHVRLLGCNTADRIMETVPREGRMLLLKLARRLGRERVVFGTIVEIDGGDFDANGFRANKRTELLYSSDAAVDYDVPAYTDRLVDMGKFWIPIPQGPHQRTGSRE